MISRIKTYLNRYRVALLSAAASVIGVFGAVGTSHAQWNALGESLLGVLGGAVGFVAYYIANFLNFVIVKLFTFAGFLIDLGITLNQGIIQHGLVRVGWLITRDVANLGFTIGIIAIAFATILRMEQFGPKKLLGKLIIVALLINFSLAIPGVILDATHVFSKFFMSKITGDSAELQKFSESIANAFNMQGMLKEPTAAALNVESISDVVTLISTVLFMALFGTLGVIALGATAYMVLYRYMVLTFLFIVAPLAWISLFLPGFGKHWKEWWDMFLKWALFLPFMTFFFYLAIYATQSAGEIGIVGAINAQTSQSLSGIASLATLGGVLGQMVVILGLLIGGLMVSQKMGIAGAAAAVGMATGVKNFALGAIKGTAVGAVAGPAKYLGTRPVKAGAMGLASLLNRPALRWIPGAKGAVAGLSQFGQHGEEISAYQKQYLSKSALPDEEFKKVLKGRLPEGPVAQAALLAEAASRGMLKEIKDDPKKLLALASAAKETNPGTEAKDVKDIQALLGVMPSLAEKITDGKLTTYEAARRFVSADKVADLTAEELGNASVIASFTQAHWKNLAESPKVSAEQMAAAQNALKKLAGDDLIELQRDYAFAQLEIDRAKDEGVPENDTFALDDKGRKIKGADGKFVISRKGLKTMKREKKVELNKRRDELFTKTSTVTEADKENYTAVINDRRMNDPKFIANFKAQYGHEPSNEELILIERGRAYKQLEDSQKQIGGLFYRPYPPRGGAGGTTPPPTPPTGGGPASGPAGTPAGGVSPSSAPQAGGGVATPAPAKSLPEMMAQLRAKQQAGQDVKEAADQAAAETARAQRSTGGFLNETEEAEERVVAEKEARVAAAQQAEAEKNRVKVPPPSLPGTRTPTTPTAQPGAGQQPTQTPLRTPTTPPVRPATPPPPPPPPPPTTPTTPLAQPGASTTPATQPKAQPGTEAAKKVEPRPATIVPPREPSRATAEQGEAAEAERRAQREREESAKRVREEAEATAAAEKERAEAAAQAAKAEEVKTAAAEKGAEAARKEAEATKVKLDTLGAALGIAKETGETEADIAKELEKGAKAAGEIKEELRGGAEAARRTGEELKKITTLRKAADFSEAFMRKDVEQWSGQVIITPDKRERVIRSVIRDNVNPMNTTIKTEDDENITLRQLYGFAEKENADVKILRK
ncbi:MAG: hypothetical protein Q7R85_03815 [bacterium]|nr:hypothetical protein [bacterium]